MALTREGLVNALFKKPTHKNKTRQKKKKERKQQGFEYLFRLNGAVSFRVWYGLRASEEIYKHDQLSDVIFLFFFSQRTTEIHRAR